MICKKLTYGHGSRTLSIRATVFVLIVVSLAGPRAQAQLPAKPVLPIRGVAFSPDGATLAVAAGNARSPAGRLTLYDVAARRIRMARDEPKGVTSLAFTPDGKSVAIGLASGTARLLDAETLAPLRDFEGHAGAIPSLAISPDGRRLATASADLKIRLWSLPQGDMLRLFEGHLKPVAAVAFAPDGRTLASSGDDFTTRVWDVETGQARHVLQPSDLVVRFVTFSPDGRHLLSCHYDGFVRIRDTATMELEARIKVSAERACFSPDGRMLAVGGTQRDVNVLGICLDGPMPEQRARIDSLVAIWNDDDYAKRETASRDIVEIGMVASGALRALSDAESAEIRIRARRANEQVWSPLRRTIAAESPVFALAFSPDGRLLAGGDRAGNVRLWDPATGAVLGTLAP